MDALLELSGVTKTYPGGVRALDGLTATLAPGAVGLIGANGAGKSTLFRVLLGLTRPDSGSARVAGIDVLTDPVGVRGRVGFMPEHDALPADATAADVVATFGELAGLPARVARQRASDVLDLVGLDEARYRPVEGFSTGMRQRTKLAQAIVADPAVVFLDEPTAGLDPAGRREMLALIRRLTDFGISIVVATHLLDDVEETCDQVLMISAGRLVAAGPTAELIRSTGSAIVDVGGSGAELAAALTGAGLAATARPDGSVEVPDADDATLDRIVATVARLELPLIELYVAETSLDDVFLAGASPSGAP